MKTGMRLAGCMFVLGGVISLLFTIYFINRPYTVPGMERFSFQEILTNSHFGTSIQMGCIFTISFLVVGVLFFIRSFTVED